jgi:outer membrane immunogenic protein
MSRGRIERLGTGSIMSNSVRCVAVALFFCAAFPASSQAQGRVGGTAGGASNWTGGYIGIHVGGGSGGQSWSELNGFNLGSGSMSGAFGGGQVGFNWQAGSIVFGVEGDASAAGISGDFSCFAPWRCDSDVKFLGSLRGRVGVATGSTGNVLIYGTGGAVWMYDKIHSFWPEIDTNFSGSQTRAGWIVGGGFELKLPQLGPDSNWSVKVEYTHSDLGTQSATLIPDTNRALTWFVNINQHVDAVKVGVNYQFGNSVFGQIRGF